MKHGLLLVWLLVSAAAVALAGLPCKTREEAMAEAVVGYFMVQEIATNRCDALLGGEAFRALHRQVTTQFARQIAGADAARAGYFQRAYGERWQEERDRVKALMADLLSASLDVTEANCAKFQAELGRRRERGWAPIQERLERRVEGIAGTDKNLCKP